MNLLACLMPTHLRLANEASRKISRTPAPAIAATTSPAEKIDRLEVQIEALRAIRRENPPAPEHEQLTRIHSLAISISQEARVRLLELNCDEAGVVTRKPGHD